MYIGVLSVHLPVCSMHILPGAFWEPEGPLMPRTGVRDGCELPCEYWEPHPGPLGQPYLLSHLFSPEFFLSTLLVNFVVYSYTHMTLPTSISE